MQETLSERFEALLLENRAADLIEITTRILAHLGIDKICYLRPLDAGNADAAEILTNYSADWKDRYIEQDYFTIDPVVGLGLSHRRTLNWLDLDLSERKLARFFGEARECGIHSCGLSVHISDSENRRALFSMNSALPRRDWESLLSERRADLLHLAHLFHIHHVEQHAHGPLAFEKLSKRELQVLSWAAAGKSCWETSQILDLSEKTVDGYLRAVYRKLHCSNKTHAVAVAMHGRMLDQSFVRQFIVPAKAGPA